MIMILLAGLSARAQENNDRENLPPSLPGENGREFEKARRCIEQALDPETGPGPENRLREGLEMMEGVVRENPGQGEAWMWLGAGYRQRAFLLYYRNPMDPRNQGQAEGDVKRAIECLKKAIELNGESAWSHYHLYLTLDMLENPGAVDYLSRAVELLPEIDRGEGEYKLGLYLISHGEAEQGKELAGKGIEISPEAGKERNNKRGRIARALIEAGDYEGAAGFYQSYEGRGEDRAYADRMTAQLRDPGSRFFRERSAEEKNREIRARIRDLIQARKYEQAREMVAQLDPDDPKSESYRKIYEKGFEQLFRPYEPEPEPPASSDSGGPGGPGRGWKNILGIFFLAVVILGFSAFVIRRLRKSD